MDTFNNNFNNQTNKICTKLQGTSNDNQEIIKKSLPKLLVSTNANKIQNIVSIDSNVRLLAKNIADRVSNNAKSWCLQLNECKLTLKSKIFYNTPISMSDDIRKYKFPNNIKHFIYLDFSQNNDTLRRILENLQYTKNYIVISNADSYAIGSYHLKIGNCLSDAVADILSIIIIVYQIESRYITKEELEKFIDDIHINKRQLQQRLQSKQLQQRQQISQSEQRLQTSQNSTLTKSNNNDIVASSSIQNNKSIKFPIVCDLYQILDRKNNTDDFLEIKDCTIFNLDDLNPERTTINNKNY